MIHKMVTFERVYIDNILSTSAYCLKQTGIGFTYIQ